MNATQIERRDRIMQQLWAVEDSSPDEPTLRSAAVRASEALKSLVDVIRRDDPREAGRTLRFLGDCYYTQSLKQDQDALQRARAAYLEARPLIERGGDLVELGKLDFNLANTSRLIDGGHNMALMQEAKRRYYAALLLFRSHMPNGVPAVESSLQSIEVGIRALQMYQQAEAGLARTKELQRRLEAAGPNPPASLLEEVRAALTGTEVAEVAAQVEEVRGFLDDVGPLLDDAQQQQWSRERDRFTALVRDMQRGSTPDAAAANWEHDAYEKLFAMLDESAQRGEVTAARQAALRAVLSDFRKIQSQKPVTPEEQLAQVGLMRTLVNRYKGITDRSVGFGA